jgi:sugar lactone lactonase YvrE
VGKHVSPKVTIVLILLTLTIVQLVYWRVLVYQPSMPPPGPPGGMGAPPLAPPLPMGLTSVRVTTLAGDATPGYQDGHPLLARFYGPSAIAADAEGNLFVSDSRNHRIRRVTPKGVVSTVAGSGETGTAVGGFIDGLAARARFSCPSGLAWHPQKGLYVADTGNHRIRLLTPQGEVKTIAGGDTPRDAVGRPSGGLADGAAAQARFRFPTGLALDGAGNLYVADTGNHCVRKITPDGSVKTLARLSTTTKIFVANDAEASASPGNQPQIPPPVKEETVKGGHVATPTSLFVTATGAVVIADAGNQCLWQIAPNGATRPLVPQPQSVQEASDATHFLRPTGLTGDEAGNFYVTDAATNCLMQWNPRNGVTLLAGHFFPVPMGSYVDDTGNRCAFATPCAIARVGKDLFIADFGNNCVRKVSDAVE